LLSNVSRDLHAARAGGEAHPRGSDFHPDRGWFASTRAPFGEGSVGLRVGPLRFALEGLSPRQEVRFAERYRPFLDGEGKPDLTIRLTRAGVGAFLVPQKSSEMYRMELRSDAGERRWWSYEFAGRLDAGRRTAELALVEEDGERSDRGLENFLRALTAEFVLAHGGLLLHGATIVRGGRAYVFFGPSGSGKTTTTRLSPDDLVLSDDLTLIVPTDGGYGACGIPFGMSHHRVPDSNEAFPIAGLHRLVQSLEVARLPVTGAAALAEVVASLPFVMDHDPGAPMENAAHLLARVPLWRLQFRKDDAFWKVIEEP
jgi:hypothetical protein